MEKPAGRKIAIISIIVCTLLTISLVGATANYSSVLSLKDNNLASKDSIINDQNSQIASLTAQLIESNNTISTLTSQLISSNDTISSLNSQILNKSANIEALIGQKTQLELWLNDNRTALNAQISYLQSQETALNSQIENLQNQSSSDKTTIAILQGQIDLSTSKINSLNSTINNLQSEIDELRAILNLDGSKLQLLVFHVCEKGTGYTWGRIPNVNSTYNQILSLYNNSNYNIILLPEYQGHKNWAQELNWLRNNFGGQYGIPVMLEVFGAGFDASPTPMLSTSDISAAMAVCNMKWIRINELVAWYMAHPELPSPAAYVRSILEFCRTNGLKVYWTEWKVESFKEIQAYILGYEDIVTVSFSTNSGELEPADGFIMVSKMFQHWGGSIQAWYSTTRYGTDPLNMPIATLIQHALLAKNIGAEILQFEPYWYFFDNGQIKENLRLLKTDLG